MVAVLSSTFPKGQRGESILVNPMEQVKLGHQAFQTFNVPAVIIDREGSIILFTAEFQERYLEQTTNAPKSIAEIFDGNTENIVKEVRTAQYGASIVLIQQLLRKHIRESFVITPLREGTKRPNYYLLCKTSQTALDRGFSELNAELKQANKNASTERAERQKLANENKHLQEYAGLAAHDLKAPLRNIRDFLLILEEDHSSELDDEAKDIVEIVRTSASRLQKLIENLLAHSKNCTMPLELEELSIKGIVDQVVENLSRSLEETNTQIRIEQPDIAIQGDPTLVHQLFENLIGNSIKYRSKSRDPQICIRLKAGNNLELEDNGLGFDNRHSEQLFEPFKRLYSASEIEGSGIGLATCKTICERHGWVIKATGEVGKGAKFTICIPNISNPTIGLAA